MGIDLLFPVPATKWLAIIYLCNKPIRLYVDYPGLNYSRVFGAETYPLADPQSTLNLSRSKQKKDNMDGDDSSIA
ncbi:hypothetical protein GWI33_019194 [Rhynchophorus ferrugineus]|uniref:Uncharacterized protein n=1 Tax=Rhynchophorus ferrugineus TaxID=354439 RepID=A0A834HU97_RHYFE|nr:hypothetical protein GWI33_019194 [Rhynchophorus ferrugineus]